MRERMPYRLILLTLVLALAVRYVCNPYPSSRSKGIVVATVATSLLAARYLPEGWLIAALMQMAVGAYILLYLTVAR